MAKLPWYLKKSEFSYSPTEFDDIGSDGLYIKKIRVHWTAKIYFITKVILKQLGEFMKFKCFSSFKLLANGE